MSLKTKFAQKLRNLLGVQQLSSMVNQELRTNRALSILSSLGLPKDVELSLQLALYPQPNEKSGITLLTSTQEYLMIKNYLSLVRPFKSRSLHLARIGGRGDGGYVMLDIESDVESKANDANNISHNNCPPPKQDLGNNSSLSSSFLLDSSTNLSFAKFSSAKPKAISLGVSAYSPWDLEMAQKGYQVIEYDASIEKSPYNHPNITFVKKFVGTEDARDTISFESVIQSQNLDPNAYNVLQVDIEDSEWAILEKADLQLIAKYFPQVLFEFHNCNPCDEALSARRLQILSKINELYAPIHTHFNHHGCAFYAIMDNEYKNGLFWCDTIEVSYIRKDLLPHDAKPLSGVGLRVGLDTPNSLFFPDLPLVFRD